MPLRSDIVLTLEQYPATHPFRVTNLAMSCIVLEARTPLGEACLSIEGLTAGSDGRFRAAVVRGYLTPSYVVSRLQPRYPDVRFYVGDAAMRRIGVA